jgi:hypothetical protein
MTSGTEPLRQATIGVPADMASIITSLNGSGLIRSKSALWGNAKNLKYKMKENPSPSFKSTQKHNHKPAICLRH